MVSNRDLEKVVEQVNSILTELADRVSKVEKLLTTKETKSKEKS